MKFFTIKNFRLANYVAIWYCASITFNAFNAYVRVIPNFGIIETSIFDNPTTVRMYNYIRN